MDRNRNPRIRDPRARTPRVRRAGLALSVAGVLALTAACGSDELGQPVAADSDDRPELVLQAALAPGADPFTEPATNLDEADLDATAQVEHDQVEVAGTEAVAAVAGDSPGLYGGTGEEGSCDTSAISAHLAADPAMARAWAEAQGIGVHGIDAFLDTLTPVVLLHDTRVTNHGYRDGVANPFQSVLQAGTAVLVDPHGVPRVRCACGNPLAEPDTSRQGTPVGTPWQGYGTTPLVTVTANAVLHVFVVVDIHSGDSYEIPAGRDGTEIEGTDVEGTDVDDADVEDADVEDAPLPEAEASTCFSRYAELVVLLTPLGLDPLDAAEWMDEHGEALAAIDAGDYESATATICALVQEMEVAYEDLAGS